MTINSIQSKTININSLSHDNKLDKKNKKNSISNIKSNNNVIQALEKEKESIQDQIQGIKDSSMDEKSKQSNIKDLNKQIEQIDSKIAEIKSEQITHKKENEEKQKKKENSTEKITYDENAQKSIQLNNLIKIASNVSKLSKMYTIKAGMKRQMNVILSEPDPIKGTYSNSQMAQMDKLSSNIGRIDEQISSKTKEVKNAAKKNIGTQGKQSSKKSKTDNMIVDDNKDTSSTKKSHKKSKKDKISTYV
ncbi:hypothetical protein [Clostridium sp. AWRP]|uniref:hypothetical protein n=1 Tax=Clostridium sp. AWRP TaxID=2212991 RepID=UPI000FDA02C8|nr:hypothetical protein [Clostridium sp. AWRP]AZV55939.1 hypothetical protein DMR38_04600 [Clostridium sp. AWRP]